ncbi:hypothetical protein [Alkalihalobacterium elongatum]|uniref:hypothetical protein n=1 Tax=Alkalihalobacterium elongatum TaxID=2675466 RepID=UPI001C1F24F3|nr:hypothetical protein [Alkalihalobacterium elongatum]
MKVINLFMTGLVILLLTGCGSSFNSNSSALQKQENTSASETGETEPFDLPEVAEISFQPLELNELLEGEPREDWEYIKSVPLSVLKEKNVTLHVYKDTDPNGLCNNSTVSILEYDDKKYELNECTSEGLLQKYLEEIGALYAIDHLFDDQERKQVVLTGIELFANGPGRMIFVIYDITDEKFLTFEDWGIPFISDLEEGEDFLVVQFPGLHLHSPDVNIYRSVKGQLEKSQSLKEALEISNQQEYLEFDGSRRLFIAYSPLDIGGEEFIKVQYKYENGKLVKY